MKFFANVFFELKRANVGEAETLELGFHLQYVSEDRPYLVGMFKLSPTKAQGYASHFFHNNIVGANAIGRIPFSTTPRQYARDVNVKHFSSEMESGNLACSDKI